MLFRSSTTAARTSEKSYTTQRSVLFSESNKFAITDWEDASNPWEGVEIVWPEPLPIYSPSPFPPDRIDRQFDPWAQVSQESIQVDDRMTTESVSRGGLILNLLALNENELLAVKQIGSAMQSFTGSQTKEERMNDNMQAPSETELTDSLNETMLASEPKGVPITQDAVTTHASDHAQSAQSQTLGQKTRKSLFPEFSPEFATPSTFFPGKIPSAVKISRQGPTNSGRRQVCSKIGRAHV